MQSLVVDKMVTGQREMFRSEATGLDMINAGMEPDEVSGAFNGRCHQVDARILFATRAPPCVRSD
jgi:hypothetical protein